MSDQPLWVGLIAVTCFAIAGYFFSRTMWRIRWMARLNVMQTDLERIRYQRDHWEERARSLEASLDQAHHDDEVLRSKVLKVVEQNEHQSNVLDAVLKLARTREFDKLAAWADKTDREISKTTSVMTYHRRTVN